MPISDRNQGTWIRSIHFTYPFMALLVVSLGSYTMARAVIASCVLASMAYVFFQDCLLSHYEQKLLKDDVYGVDLFLEAFGVSTSTSNRFFGTILVGFCFYMLVGYIMVARFGRRTSTRK